MTFLKYFQNHKKNGGCQKTLAAAIGITEAQMSRLMRRKQAPGLKLLNRIVGVSHSKITIGELCLEFRPDIYKLIMGNCPNYKKGGK